MSLVVVLDNIRSAHNVGAIWRTAEAAGVERLMLIGGSAHPPYAGDPRPPYLADRALGLIRKTSLGAEAILPFEYYFDVASAIFQLQHNHYQIASLEIADDSINVFNYTPPSKLALILGHETAGISLATLGKSNVILEIPMSGRKESLNVSVAAGIAIYQLSLGLKQ
jgi:23S rRNA (guanosine2251-2'-O)-methyltransferase